MPAPSPKYELLHDQVRSLWDGAAFRIRALRDIPEHKVRIGDLGGFVEGERNLSHEGAAWIADEAMAVDQSRVEGDALMQGYSHMRGQSVLHGTATIGGHVGAADRAVIGGNVRLLGSVRVEDDTLVVGDITTSHPIRLSGNAVYRRQADLPWSLRHADPAEPGWIDRMREAIEIDPAFHRAFAALGAEEPAERRAALDALWSDRPTGRQALADIARTIGGTFRPDAYEPRTAASLVDDGGIDIAVQSDAAGLTGFRYLRTLSGITAEDQPGGDRIHAGVVAAKMRDPTTGEPRTLYQPALHHEADLERPALTPLAGRTYVSSEVYADEMDARRRAGDLLRMATVSVGAERDISSSASQRSTGLLDHLPFVARATPVEDAADWSAPRTVRFAVQRVEASPSPVCRQLSLREPRGHLLIEVGKVQGASLDLADVLSHSGLSLHGAVEEARRNVEPIYTGRADFVARLKHGIARREDGSHLPDRQGHLELVEVIDRPPPTPIPAPVPTPDASDELNHAAILAALRPLDWRNARNDQLGVGRYHDDVFEAESFNALFTVEPDGDSWSLHVEPPGTTARQHVMGHVRPFHREDGLPSEEAAMEAAENYRARLVAAELDAPLNAPRPAPSPEVFSNFGSWHVLDEWTEVRGYAISRDRNGYSGYQAHHDISVGGGDMNPTGIGFGFWDDDAPIYATAKEAISAGLRKAYGSEAGAEHLARPPEPAAVAVNESVKLPAVFRVSAPEGGEPSYRAGGVAMRHGRLSITADPDPHPSIEEAAAAAIERLRTQQRSPSPIVDAPRPAAVLAPSA